MYDRAPLRWIDIGYCMHGPMKKAGMDLSMLVRGVIHLLHPARDGAWDLLATGCILRHGGDQVHVRFRLQAFLQDAAAHKESLSLKGCSVSSPCPSSANVVAGVQFFRGHSCLVHIHDLTSPSDERGYPLNSGMLWTT